MKRIDIKSSKTNAVLSFLNLTSRDFEISYQSSHFSAQMKVLNDDEERSLQDFFARLAQHSKGWQGELSWTPMFEKYIKISATVDKTGHVALKIVFDGYSRTEPWLAETILHTELGLLEKISKDVHIFFSA